MNICLLICLTLAALLLFPKATQAEGFRIATYHSGLGRRGPGLLLRDLRAGKDAQIAAALAVIVAAQADVLILQDVDHDAGLQAAQALRDALAAAGQDYPHLFALSPNSGLTTGLDMDGDGRLGRARDAQGYGRFRGAGGLLILSRYPIRADLARDFTPMLWRDLPGARLPQHPDGLPFPSEAAQAIQRLSSVAHWAVPVEVPGGRVTLLVWHATPPLFDGPEGRNRLRNHDEAHLWSALLAGQLGTVPDWPVLVGLANIDPVAGRGDGAALRALLSDPRLTPLAPEGAGGTATLDLSARGAAALRVSYILPDARIAVQRSGVLWPAPDDPLAETVTTASRHRLVWADLVMPPGADAPPPPPAPDPVASR